jgi:hypothetical protein
VKESNNVAQTPLAWQSQQLLTLVRKALCSKELQDRRHAEDAAGTGVAFLQAVAGI